MSENVLPMISSRSFMMSCLIFKSLAILFLCMVRGCVLILLLFMWLSGFPTPFAKEMVFSPLCFLASFVEDWLTIGVWGYFRAVYSLPLIHSSVFVSKICCFDCVCCYTYVFHRSVRLCSFFFILSPLLLRLDNFSLPMFKLTDFFLSFLTKIYDLNPLVSFWFQLYYQFHNLLGTFLWCLSVPFETYLYWVPWTIRMHTAHGCFWVLINAHGIGTLSWMATTVQMDVTSVALMWYSLKDS